MRNKVTLLVRQNLFSVSVGCEFKLVHFIPPSFNRFLRPERSKSSCMFCLMKWGRTEMRSVFVFHLALKSRAEDSDRSQIQTQLLIPVVYLIHFSFDLFYCWCHISPCVSIFSWLRAELWIDFGVKCVIQMHICFASSYLNKILPAHTVKQTVSITISKPEQKPLHRKVPAVIVLLVFINRIQKHRPLGGYLIIHR